MAINLAKSGSISVLPIRWRGLQSCSGIMNERAIQEAVDRLARQFRPDRIILYGSHSRGDADPRSDVDLLVVAPVDGDRLALVRAMDRALKGLRMPRDIVVYSPEEYEREREIPGTVARAASVEGRVLYERAA